jgi:hypothetical protein
VLLAYFYNISRGVNQSSKPIFGNFMFSLEDKIQSRMQELWGMSLFPNFINIVDHELVADCMAVGVFH